MISGGIIAAGLGTRFQDAGIKTPKPLIEVKGRPLLARAVDQFLCAGINSLRVIFRSSICDECGTFLEENFPGLCLDIICRDTDSSAESFLVLLSRCKAREKILITTVDSIYRSGALRKIKECTSTGQESRLYLGVTSFIDDEKPLFVNMDGNGRILSLGGRDGQWITSGIYCLPAGLAAGKEAKSYSALRDLLGEFVSMGVQTYGVGIGKVVDVDRPQDIDAAEEFLMQHG